MNEIDFVKKKTEEEINAEVESCDYCTFFDVIPNLPQRAFLRPCYVEPFDCSDEVTFMIMNMDTVNTVTTQWEVVKRHAPDRDPNARPNYWKFFMRLFGVTKEGHSVTCYLEGFYPFVYVQIPRHWTMKEVDEFMEYLDCAADLKNFKRGIHRVSIDAKTNVYGYTNNESLHLMKIEFYSQSARKKFCTFLGGYYEKEEIMDEDGVNVIEVIERCLQEPNRTANNYTQSKYEFWLYDNTIDPKVQFVNHTGIRPSTWITIPSLKYSRANPPFVDLKDRRSRTQIDINSLVQHVVKHPDRFDIAPFLCESWDIECVRGPRDGIFPNANNDGDMIIQIGTSVWRYGDADFIHQSVHCLRKTACLDDVPYDIWTYETEAQLLEQYMTYTRDFVDSDMKIGWNVYGFDNLYLDTRNMKLLQHLIPSNANSLFNPGFFEYGRIVNQQSLIKESFGGSVAHGKRTTHEIPQLGRIQFDECKHAMENWKYRSNKLNDIAEELLGLHKDDVDHFGINRMFDETPYKRGIVAKYCRVDTELPIKIMRKKEVVEQMMEQSRLCGVNLHEIFNRKMTHRVFSIVSEEMSNVGLVIPDRMERFVKDPALIDLMTGVESPEGAVVLPPVVDFYAMPIVTLDFNSLYPSIMFAHDLCFTTMILDPVLQQDETIKKHLVQIRNPHRPEAPPYNTYWAKLDSKPMIPRVIQRLLEARAKAKLDMEKAEKEGDLFKVSLLNGRQLALKLIANSLYGFTIAKVGKLFAPVIGATVTHFGRLMINSSKDYVLYKVPNSRVVYGDTDSIFIDFGLGESHEAFLKCFDLGKEIALEITNTFPPGIVLAFEKVFRVLILYGKKQYAGILYKTPTKGKFSKSGIASVRGDKIGFVKKLTDLLINRMIEDRSTVNAKKLLLEHLRNLLDDNVPIEDLVIHKKLSKEANMYFKQTESRDSFRLKIAKDPEHVIVTKEMQKRCPGQAPVAGSVVSYVLVFDKELNITCPIDVGFFLKNRHRFRINTEHYLTNLIQEMLGKLIDLPSFDKDPFRLFDPFIAEAKSKNLGSSMVGFCVKRPLLESESVETAKHLPVLMTQMKMQREKKQEERRLRDAAKGSGRSYESLKEGNSIASFVKKRPFVDEKQ